MNAGGPPPPPPPPPIPGIIPSPRLPTEMPQRIHCSNTPPAAIAGAMMKDKKPFTYTPGGLDLSEISTPFRPTQQNGGGVNMVSGNSANSSPPPSSGSADEAGGAPLQSRSFRVLQNVLDSQDTTEPQGPVHLPKLRPQGQQQQQQQQQQHFPTYTDDVANSASDQQAMPEPKKYMGGHIPSRSFRMLQAMTADEVAGPGQSDL